MDTVTVVKIKFIKNYNSSKPSANNSALLNKSFIINYGIKIMIVDIQIGQYVSHGRTNASMDILWQVKYSDHIKIVRLICIKDAEWIVMVNF